MEFEDVKKSHRKRQSGRKAEKKKRINKDGQKPGSQQFNKKAFSIQSVNKTARVIRRTLDLKTKKHHIPLIDRTPLEPPPVVVVVVGPPKVGKTTLLSCLVKNYTKQKLSKPHGPITVVSGKHQRLTFIECNNDINSMIDVAKVADLVLLLVDASFGFEMETFEFLNICQVHGFPRIMGVLTHLDLFGNVKQLRKTKKRLKQRFWTEIYQGAKLFYLSGMIHGEYQKTEIHNLCRFMSVMKYRPLQWRTTHPFLLIDRMEDITNMEMIRKNPKSDRNICLYGYLRGSNMKNNTIVHIPGCGDHTLHDISLLPDPCPTPKEEKKRSLNPKERLIYAPMSGVGGIVYDKDAVYIDVGGSHSLTERMETDKPANRLMSGLLDVQNTVDQKISDSHLTVFSNGVPWISADADLDESHSAEKTSATDSDAVHERRPVFAEKEDNSRDGDSEDSSGDDFSEDEVVEPNAKKAKLFEIEDAPSIRNGDIPVNDSDQDVESNRTKNNNEKLSSRSEEESDLDDVSEDSQQNDGSDSGQVKWKTNLMEKAATSFRQRQTLRVNYRKIVYGQDDEEEEVCKEDELGGLFKVLQQKSQDGRLKKVNSVDCSKFQVKQLQDWDLKEVRNKIKNCFVTGSWDEDTDAETLLKQDAETLPVSHPLYIAAWKERKQCSAKTTDEVIGGSGDEQAADKETEEEMLDVKERKKLTLAEKRLEKKRKLKEMFDREFDQKGDSEFYDKWKTETTEQAKLNKSEFDNLNDELRVQYEGFRAGMYLRIEIKNMPCEFVNYFDPDYPVILGGLPNTERNVGFVQVRIKKHRWYKKILKTRNPLILSVGWRRFQTVPLFCMQDHNFRNRLLKYTPEYLHCHAMFWGPIVPQGTGVLAVESLDGVKPNFRIAATGVVLELDKSKQIVKKLKLTGIPYKVFQKTAFIKDMFNSCLEVKKFEGASIQTVSGVRGQIKRALNSTTGSFRAMFEDKILMSDIVFLRTWYPVAVPEFYNPVTSLLLPSGDKTTWKGMKTVGELRKESGRPVPMKTDSMYKPIIRSSHRFAPLTIPKSLQKELPFNNTPKNVQLKPTDPFKRVAVIKDSKEVKISKMLKMLKTVYVQKRRTARNEMRTRAAKHHVEMSRIEAKRGQHRKEIKKKLYRVLGKLQENENKN